jgi:hypothetical protein
VHSVYRLTCLKQRALCNNMIALKFETFVSVYAVDSGYFLQQNGCVNICNEILCVQCEARTKFSYIDQKNLPERISRSRSYEVCTAPKMYDYLSVNFHCCTVHFDSLILLLLQLMHSIYTLKH